MDTERNGITEHNQPVQEAEINQQDDLEIDASLVYSQDMSLRAAAGAVFQAVVDVFECPKPYVLVFVITMPDGHSQRMDIHKEHLASELRRWLEGNSALVPHPMLVPNPKTDDKVLKFVKFGNPPSQEILFKWILSRTEIQWGDNPNISFGGLSKLENSLDSSSFMNTNRRRFSNDFPMTVNAAQSAMHKNEFQLPASYIHDTLDARDHGDSTERVRENSNSNASPEMSYEGYENFLLTNKILGKSKALELLKETGTRRNYREGASRAASVSSMSSMQFKLGTNIEKLRKEIEVAMEERRRIIEIGNVRREQMSTKYGKIKDQLREERNSGSWHAIALEELNQLRNTKEEIERNIIKQRIKCQREQQLLLWTLAPPGFPHHRGRSMPGYPIGKGPLPPTATTNPRDPRIESASKKYYWDEAGRRHVKSDTNSDSKSVVDQALEAIRLASLNVSAYKLDLKKVFQTFDASNNGYLSKQEMAEAFLSLGVPIDVETSEELFRHFDPNGSGSVNYGEFQWAFFNRRALARKYKRHVSGLTPQQIIQKFHKYDINGDGVLNRKEFSKLLKEFQLYLLDEEIDLIIDRFDKDGDGYIDIYEFKDFIDEEVNKLNQTISKGPETSSSSRDTAQGLAESHTNRGRNPRPSLSQTQANASRERSKSVDRRLNKTTNDLPSNRRNVLNSMTFNRSVTFDDSRLDEYNLMDRDSELEETKSGKSILDAALWLGDILHAQANIESKVGSKYYS